MILKKWMNFTLHNENVFLFFYINTRVKHYMDIVCKCCATIMLVNSTYILIVTSHDEIHYNLQRQPIDWMEKEGIVLLAKELVKNELGLE